MGIIKINTATTNDYGVIKQDFHSGPPRRLKKLNVYEMLAAGPPPPQTPAQPPSPPICPVSENKIENALNLDQNCPEKDDKEKIEDLILVTQPEEVDHPNFVIDTLHAPYKFQVDRPKDKTMVEYLLHQTARHIARGQGDSKWITNTETGEFCTVSQLEPLSRSVASSFHKRGMRRGDFLIYSAHHPTRLHALLFGCWRANGAARAVHPTESVQNMTEIIRECQAKWFVCDPESISRVIEAIRRVSWPIELIVCGDGGKCEDPLRTCTITPIDDFFCDDGQDYPRLEVEDDDVVLIWPTSGTTGPSKGCVHTHAGLTKMFPPSTTNGGMHSFKNDENCLILAQPTSVEGAILPLIKLAEGTKVLMMRNICKENILQSVHEHKPKTVWGAPKHLIHLAHGPDTENFDLTPIRMVQSSCEVITPNLISSIESALPNSRVVVEYGLVEARQLISTRNVDPDAIDFPLSVWQDVPDFSVGKLLPGVSMQVRDIATDEPILGPNELGQLFFKAPIMCEGYFQPEETVKNFPGGQWLKTGDVGYFDKNEFIFVVDRVTEIFKYRGSPISPTQIEHVIQRHPAVGSVCVIGVYDPDGGNTIPRAFVTLKDSQASPTDIWKFANDHLASHQQLRGGLIVLPELPVGEGGQFDRRSLKRIRSSF